MWPLAKHATVEELKDYTADVTLQWEHEHIKFKNIAQETTETYKKRG